MNNDHSPDRSAEFRRSQSVPLAAGRRDVPVISAFKDGQEPTSSSVTELDLFSPMAERRERTHAQMARMMEELERLRGQRDDLDREKQRLEIMEQRQVKYERECRDLRDGLTHRVERLRKMDMEASRRAELFAAVRHRFEEMLREVDQLREPQWAEERYDEELNRALAILEDVEREYHRAWSRVEAVANEPSVAGVASPLPAGMPRSASVASLPQGFAEWFRVGMAVSLPLAVIFVALFVAARWLWGR